LLPTRPDVSGRRLIVDDGPDGVRIARVEVDGHGHSPRSIETKPAGEWQTTVVIIA
jgi:hypothetical protein